MKPNPDLAIRNSVGGGERSAPLTPAPRRTTTVPLNLPGADLVSAGIEALRRGEATIEALLVMTGTRRMRAAGLDVPRGLPLAQFPEHALYKAIAADHPDDAHSRYNALIRRLVSFEHALERRQSRKLAGGS